MATMAFYIFSLFLMISATAVILVRNPVHSVLFLILCFFNAAGLFILLGAEFVAMILVIVYVGAVAVLLLFVVMMLDIKTQAYNLWFVDDQWQNFKQAGRDMVVYASVWTIIWFSSNRYLQPFSQYVLSLLSPYETPMLLMQNLNIDREKVIFVIITAAWLTLGAWLTFGLTRIRFFKTINQLYKSLPVPFIISAVLAIELIITSWFWWRHGTDLRLNTLIVASQGQTNTHAMAPLIYQDYMLIFLMSGLVLLVAMIGAIVLTLHEPVNSKRQHVGRQLSRNKGNSLKICKVQIGEGLQ